MSEAEANTNSISPKRSIQGYFVHVIKVPLHFQGGLNQPAPWKQGVQQLDFVPALEGHLERGRLTDRCAASSS